VPLYDLGRDVTGQPFFTMKRLTGTTLAHMLADGREGHTPQRLLRAFTDVCLAVEFAHTRGIIHRDLKPENIVLGDFGEVHVLDWGVARAVTEPDDTGATPGAVAQVSGLELDSGETRAGTLLGTPEAGAIEFYEGRWYITGTAKQRVIDRTGGVIVATTTQRTCRPPLILSKSKMWVGRPNSNIT
jgi:serine/threonine protein kinase